MNGGQKGFTLIELLVVISIIGMLSSIVFNSVNSARTKAQIGSTREIMTQYRNALELYRDKYGDFPDPGDTNSHCVGVHPGGVCGANGSLTQDASLNSAISEFLPGPPALAPIEYNVGVLNVIERGPTYACGTILGACGRPLNIYMRWSLPGFNQKCSPGYLASGINPGVTFCEIILK